MIKHEFQRKLSEMAFQALLGPKDLNFETFLFAAFSRSWNCYLSQFAVVVVVVVVVVVKSLLFLLQAEEEEYQQL